MIPSFLAPRARLLVPLTLLLLGPAVSGLLPELSAQSRSEIRRLERYLTRGEIDRARYDEARRLLAQEERSLPAWERARREVYEALARRRLDVRQLEESLARADRVALAGSGRQPLHPLQVREGLRQMWQAGAIRKGPFDDYCTCYELDEVRRDAEIRRRMRIARDLVAGRLSPERYEWALDRHASFLAELRELHRMGRIKRHHLDHAQRLFGCDPNALNPLDRCLRWVYADAVAGRIRVRDLDENLVPLFLGDARPPAGRRPARLRLPPAPAPTLGLTQGELRRLRAMRREGRITQVHLDEATRLWGLPERRLSAGDRAQRLVYRDVARLELRPGQLLPQLFMASLAPEAFLARRGAGQGFGERERRLAALDAMREEGRLPLSSWREARFLLESEPGRLNESQQRRREVYGRLCDGNLPANQLTQALGATRPPAVRGGRQRTERLQRLDDLRRQRQLSDALWREARLLVVAPRPNELSDLQQRRRRVYLDLADGALPARALQSRLEAASRPVSPGPGRVAPRTGRSPAPGGTTPRIEPLRPPAGTGGQTGRPRTPPRSNPPTPTGRPGTQRPTPPQRPAQLSGEAAQLWPFRARQEISAEDWRLGRSLLESRARRMTVRNLRMRSAFRELIAGTLPARNLARELARIRRDTSDD